MLPSKQFPSLPDDIKAGLDKYERDIAAGVITFDPSGYARFPYSHDDWIQGMLDSGMANGDLPAPYAAPKALWGETRPQHR